MNKNKKTKDTRLIDLDTLTFVAIHELAHIMTVSIGHKAEFWGNMKFLLQNAKEAKIHEPKDYKKDPEEYCGMTISDNPYSHVTNKQIIIEAYTLFEGWKLYEDELSWTEWIISYFYNNSIERPLTKYIFNLETGEVFSRSH